MPLKPKYSREEIIDAAFALAREKDMSAISARAVGKRLNVSSSPIFTVFECMEQLRAEVWKRAVAFFRRTHTTGLRRSSGDVFHHHRRRDHQVCHQ